MTILFSASSRKATRHNGSRLSTGTIVMLIQLLLVVSYNMICHTRYYCSCFLFGAGLDTDIYFSDTSIVSVLN